MVADQRDHADRRRQSHKNRDRPGPAITTCGPLRELARLQPDDQHKDHGGEQLNQNLGERHIGATQGQNLQGNTDTGSADRNHSRQTTSRHDRDGHTNNDRDQGNVIQRAVNSAHPRTHIDAIDGATVKQRPDSHGTRESNDRQEREGQVARRRNRIRHGTAQLAPAGTTGNDTLEHVRSSKGGQFLADENPRNGLAEHDTSDTDDDDHDADHQRHVDAVEQGEVSVGRVVRAQCGIRCGVHEGIHEAGDKTERQGQETGDRRGEPQGQRCLVDVADVACSVDETAENVAVGVGEGQDRAHSSADEQEGGGRGG